MYMLTYLYLSKIAFFFAKTYPGGCLQDKRDRTLFLGLPKWYRYLSYTTNVYSHRCEINIPNNGISSNYWLIGMAILEMLLRIGGLVAIVFIMWGGFTYLTSQGEPDKLADARTTIVNALVGAVIAIVAVQVVGFVGDRLGG